MNDYNIRNHIRSCIAYSGMSLTEVANAMNTSRQANNYMTMTNLSNKISRENIRYRECLELADAIGYDIVWVKRDK